MEKLTVDNKVDISEVNLTPGLHSGFAAVHTLICFSHFLNL